jgi:hypothetical protein
VLFVIGLILPGVVVGWLSVRHDEAMDNLRQEVKRLRAEERGGGAISRRTLARERVEDLQKQMEGRSRLAARLEQLHRIAVEYGVRIGKANYLMQAADRAAGGIGRYDMRFETEASYYELRFFLRDLLAADPQLALESIELRRPPSGGYNAGGKPILAIVHIVMYFGTVE